MPNPISDPLVENVLSSDLRGLVDVDADPRGVVTLTINGVGPGNALNGEVAAALAEAFETLHAADRVRLVLLRGAGGRFSSGHDRAWLQAAADGWGEDEWRDEAMTYARMLHALARIPALTVAVVEGEAGGPGAGLVAACDMTLAAADARFSFPEVKSGAAPAVVAPYVVEAVGPRQARGLFLTGRAIDAAEALRIGLVQQVADGPALGAAIARLADEALEAAPGAMALAKHLVHDVGAGPVDHGLMSELARQHARSRQGPEGREGLAAALEGRKPGWASA